jgi:hypothetical protein
MSGGRVPKNPKGKLEKEAHALSERIADTQYNLSDRGNYQTGRGRDETTNEFPAQYFPDQHEEDQRIDMKAKLLQGPDRPLGDAMLTDKDIDYFIKKEETKKRIAFDEWYSHLFDTKDINKRRLAQQMYPEYWQMREREIDRQAAIQKKIALLKLRGPQDKSDLEFIYALQNGEMDFRPVPLYQLDTPQTDTAARFKKGLFNPTRYTDIQQGYVVPQTGRDMFNADHTLNTVGSGFVSQGARDQFGASGRGPLTSKWWTGLTQPWR